jgi:HlyD family secretion protein
MKIKKIFKSKKLKWGLLLLLLVGVYIYYQKSNQSKDEIPITTATTTYGTVETVIQSTGTLNPASQFEVKSLVKGTILKAPFEEGDNIKKGSTLYEISTNEISKTIQTSEFSLKKANYAYEDCVDKSDDLTLTAHQSGYIKKLYVKKGDKVQAGTNIADLYNGDVLYLDLLFPDPEVKSSWIGKSATVLMDSSDATVKGKVTAVSDMTESMIGGILGRKVTIRIDHTTGISSTSTATAQIGKVTSNNSATFRAETEATITATNEGVIESLSIEPGDWVDAGSKLLTLSSKDLTKQIRDAKVAVEEAELSLKSQKEQLNLYNITSPISGTVIAKNKKQDDTIDPSIDTQAGSMATIYDMSYLTFQMNIDELQIRSLKKGQKVTVHSDALSDQTFEGIIDRISLKGTTNNGITSYPVTVKVDSFGDLLPGMNVSGTIAIERAENVLTVPSSALQRGNIVYVQDKGAKNGKDTENIPDGFKAVQVEVGLDDGTNVEIKSGLKEGDIVYLPFDATVESSIEMY